MNLNISQLLALASAAGFQGDDLATAVAVALAESGGNPQAYNPEKAARAPEGMGSFGLWQIYKNAHPEFAGENLFDPQTNAAAAFAIYQAAGSSFGPWSTFKNGAYSARLDAVNQTLQAQAQPADVVASDGTDQTQGAPDGSTDTSGGPSGGEVVGIAVGAIVALWAISRLMG